MYSITVRDRCAYALSLKLGNAPLFRTGVTALVDAKLSGPELGPDGLLIDFVAVQLALGATLAPLQNADLDRLRPFAGSTNRVSFREGAPPPCINRAGRNATAEIVAQFICDGLLAKIRELPGLPPVHVTKVEITVRTSDVVAASYVRENGMGLI
mgnify:FL=1